MLRTCPKCGAEADIHDDFCSECATTLPPLESAEEFSPKAMEEAASPEQNQPPEPLPSVPAMPTSDAGNAMPPIPDLPDLLDLPEFPAASPLNANDAKVQANLLVEEEIGVQVQ